MLPCNIRFLLGDSVGEGRGMFDMLVPMCCNIGCLVSLNDMEKGIGGSV